MTLFSLYFIENSTTYWPENWTQVQPIYGNLGLSFFFFLNHVDWIFLLRELGSRFSAQFSSNAINKDSQFEKIRLKTKMRTEYPCENRSILVPTFTPSMVFCFLVSTHSFPHDLEYCQLVVCKACRRLSILEEKGTKKVPLSCTEKNLLRALLVLGSY